MRAFAALVLLVGSCLAAPQLPFNQVAYAPAPAPAVYATPVSRPAYVRPVAPVAYKPAPAIYAAPVAAPTYVRPPAPVVSYKPAPAIYAAPVRPQAPVVAYQPAPAPIYPAQQQYVQPSVAILRQSQDDNFDGSFSYDFQAENGIASQASGFLKNLGPEGEAQVIQGVYSYTAPDGTPIVTRWYADETGFHAEGDHIPATGSAGPAGPAAPVRAP